MLKANIGFSNHIFRLLLVLSGFFIVGHTAAYAGSNNTTWKPIPAEIQKLISPLDYSGNKLKQNWSELQSSYGEPWPSANRLKNVFKQHPKLDNKVANFNGDYDAYAKQIQQAWRLFFQGQLKEAHDLGYSLGHMGYAPATHATLTYAFGVLDMKKDKSARYMHFKEASAKSKEVLDANHNDLTARIGIVYAMLGELRDLSRTEIIKNGYIPKSVKLVTANLALDPNHGVSLSLYGGLAGNIAGAVPGLIAKGIFGMTPEVVESTFDRALINREFSANIHLEYARALLSVDKSDYKNKVIAHLKAATNIKPRHANDAIAVFNAKVELKKQI